MADRLLDSRCLNPPIFIGSKTLEDIQEFVDQVHKILVDIADTGTEKVELDFINLWMLRRHGARYGRIAERWADFRSLGTCLRQPSRRYSSPGR